MKKAIVLGHRGQAGSYMVDFLAHKGYTTYFNLWDLARSDTFGTEFREQLIRVQPDEIYNFAGKQFAPDSWKEPERYTQINGTAVLGMLNLASVVSPQAKFFNAGSADMFDKSTTSQSEDTAKKPDNPYGLSKLFAYEAVRIYRERGLFACTGIFFNMESPRRKKTFFAEKVVSEAVRIKRELDSTGKFKPMQLGRLDAYRDWGWAPEYVEVAWRMLQQEQAEDFVIGTGESYSCYEYVCRSLLAAGIRVKDLGEIGAGSFSGEWSNIEDYFSCEPPGFQITKMQAVPTKAKEKLGWEAKYKMKDVIRMLVEAEFDATKTVAEAEEKAKTADL